MFSKNYCRKKFKFYCVFSIPFYKTGKVFILTSHVNIACKDMQVKMCSEEKQLLGGWRHCSCVRRVHSSSRVWHSCGWFLGILGPLQGKRWLLWALVQSCCRGHTAGDSCSCWALPLLLPKSPGTGAGAHRGLRGPRATTVTPTAVTVVKPAATPCCLCSWSSHAWANWSLPARVSEDAAGQGTTCQQATRLAGFTPFALESSEQG